MIKRRIAQPPSPGLDMASVAILQHQVAETLRAVDSIRRSAEEEIAAIEERAARNANPLRRKALRLARKIDAFARQHKASLTRSSKTFKVPGGSALKWRKKRLEVKFDNEEQVLAFLKENGYREFIRTREEPFKTAMKEHPRKAARIPGVRIESGSKFVMEFPGVRDKIERTGGSRILEIIESE